MRKTYSPKIAEIERHWHVVDADGLCLGRLAAGVASVLRGKNKPTYTPHMDTGDFVVVINAEKIAVSGNKEDQKIYYTHTGRPGSLKSETVRERRQKRPRKIIEDAVKGMLPHTRLGRRLYGKLKVYAGPEHPHHAQQPQLLELPEARVGARRIS
jgi:large subunit ribosomal protein L13